MVQHAASATYRSATKAATQTREARTVNVTSPPTKPLCVDVEPFPAALAMRRVDRRIAPVIDKGDCTIIWSDAVLTVSLSFLVDNLSPAWYATLAANVKRPSTNQTR